MSPQAKECWPPPENRRGKKPSNRFSRGASEGVQSCQQLDFKYLAAWTVRINLLFLSHHVCGHLSQQDTQHTQNNSHIWKQASQEHLLKKSTWYFITNIIPTRRAGVKYLAIPVRTLPANQILYLKQQHFSNRRKLFSALSAIQGGGVGGGG